MESTQFFSDKFFFRSSYIEDIKGGNNYYLHLRIYTRVHHLVLYIPLLHCGELDNTLYVGALFVTVAFGIH